MREPQGPPSEATRGPEGAGLQGPQKEATCNLSEDEFIAVNNYYGLPTSFGRSEGKFIPERHRLSGAQKRKLKRLAALKAGHRVIPRRERRKNSGKKLECEMGDKERLLKEQSEFDKIVQWMKTLRNLPENSNADEVAVVLEGFPCTKMTKLQAEELISSVSQRINFTEHRRSIKFNSHRYENGAMIFSCGNEMTKMWLRQTIPKLSPWLCAKLEAGPADIILHGVKFIFWVSKLMKKRAIDQILDLIEKQNKGISTSEWTVTAKSDFDTKAKLEVWFDNRTLNVLKGRDLKLHLGLGRIVLKPSLQLHQIRKELSSHIQHPLLEKSEPMKNGTYKLAVVKPLQSAVKRVKFSDQLISLDTRYSHPVQLESSVYKSNVRGSSENTEKLDHTWTRDTKIIESSRFVGSDVTLRSGDSGIAGSHSLRFGEDLANSRVARLGDTDLAHSHDRKFGNSSILRSSDTRFEGLNHARSRDTRHGVSDIVRSCDTRLGDTYRVHSDDVRLEDSNLVLSQDTRLGHSDIVSSHETRFRDSDITRSHETRFRDSDSARSHETRFRDSDSARSHETRFRDSDSARSHETRFRDSDSAPSHETRFRDLDSAPSHETMFRDSDITRSHETRFRDSDSAHSHETRFRDSDIARSRETRFGDSDLVRSRATRFSDLDLDRTRETRFGDSDLVRSRAKRFGDSDLTRSRETSFGDSNLVHSRETRAGDSGHIISSRETRTKDSGLIHSRETRSEDSGITRSRETRLGDSDFMRYCETGCGNSDRVRSCEGRFRETYPAHSLATGRGNSDGGKSHATRFETSGSSYSLAGVSGNVEVIRSVPTELSEARTTDFRHSDPTSSLTPGYGVSGIVSSQQTGFDDSATTSSITKGFGNLGLSSSRALGFTDSSVIRYPAPGLKNFSMSHCNATQFEKSNLGHSRASNSRNSGGQSRVPGFGNPDLIRLPRAVGERGREEEVEEKGVRKRGRKRKRK